MLGLTLALREEKDFKELLQRIEYGGWYTAACSASTPPMRRPPCGRPRAVRWR